MAATDTPTPRSAMYGAAAHDGVAHVRKPGAPWRRPAYQVGLLGVGLALVALFVWGPAATDRPASALFALTAGNDAEDDAQCVGTPLLDPLDVGMLADQLVTDDFQLFVAVGGDGQLPLGEGGVAYPVGQALGPFAGDAALAQLATLAAAGDPLDGAEFFIDEDDFDGEDDEGEDVFAVADDEAFQDDEEEDADVAALLAEDGDVDPDASLGTLQKTYRALKKRLAGWRRRVRGVARQVKKGARKLAKAARKTRRLQRRARACLTRGKRRIAQQCARLFRKKGAKQVLKCRRAFSANCPLLEEFGAFDEEGDLTEGEDEEDDEEDENVFDFLDQLGVLFPDHDDDEDNDTGDELALAHDEAGLSADADVDAEFSNNGGKKHRLRVMIAALHKRVARFRAQFVALQRKLASLRVRFTRQVQRRRRLKRRLATCAASTSRKARQQCARAGRKNRACARAFNVPCPFKALLDADAANEVCGDYVADDAGLNSADKSVAVLDDEGGGEAARWDLTLHTFDVAGDDGQCRAQCAVLGVTSTRLA